VATRNGGPVDIVATLGNGVLVEPTDEGAIASALVKARRARLARRRRRRLLSRASSSRVCRRSLHALAR